MAYINTVQRVQLNDARQEGVEQGIEQGMLKGAVGTLQKQLKLKFGDLPGWAQQRLEQATPEQLDALTEQVLIAENLEFMQVDCCKRLQFSSKQRQVVAFEVETVGY